jgi:hypothetical protein
MNVEIDEFDLENAGSEFYSELDRFRDALTAISTLNPRDDSSAGWNEWGCAECFHTAQEIAREALRVSK